MAFNEKKFNRIFNVCILAGMTIMTVLMTAFKIVSADTGKLLLLVSAFGSIMGVCSTVTSANGKIWTFFFGFFDVSIYAVACFIGAKYGNAVLHAVYFVPMQFIGWYQWNKRGKSEENRVKARRFNRSQWLLYTVIFLLGSVISYFILARFDKESADAFIKWAVVLDVVPMMCNILGQLLMSMAYMEQWVFWIGVNIFSILMWITTYSKTQDSYALIYVIKYSFYLINSLNGLRIWINISRPDQPGVAKSA